MTAYEMRISDWSSDVCSSDLTPQQLLKRGSFERLEDQDRCAGLNGVVELVGRVLCCGADQDDYARLYRSQQQILNRLRHPMNFIDEKSGSFAGFSKHLRSEEHTSELQSLMRISYAVFCLK